MILFITWLYLGSVVILLGATTNSILSSRTRYTDPESSL